MKKVIILGILLFSLFVGNLNLLIEQEEMLFVEIKALRSNERVNITYSSSSTYRNNYEQLTGGSGSSLLPKFTVGESNETHVFVPDPTNQTDGSYIERESGYQELNSSRGQSYRHFYDESTGQYTFQSDYLVNKTDIIEDTDWVTSSEYPTRFVVRLTNGSVYFSESLSQVETIFSNIDNSTLWGVGVETFSGIMGFYTNFADTDWGHCQYLYYPRLLDGQLTAYNFSQYGIYPHLYAKLGGTWYDKILNDRSLYSGIVDPRNTLHFNKTPDTWELWFDTFGITIMGRVWDFKHGFKYNTTDHLFHMITRFRCRDQDFEDLGVAYEITSSPQSDGTEYQPNQFILSNDTHSVVANISQAWNAGEYLNDFYSRIEIISQNNEGFIFTFSDMDEAGFTEKYLNLHQQQFPDGSSRLVLRAGMYGYGSYVQGTIVEIDPDTGNKYASDNYDLCRKGSTWEAGLTVIRIGEEDTLDWDGFISYNTGIETAIMSITSNNWQGYIAVNYFESGEGVRGTVYNVKGNADTNTAREDSQSYSWGAYYSTSGLLWSGPNGGAWYQADATQTDGLLEYWADYRDSNDEWISFHLEGLNGENEDYLDIRDSQGTSDSYIQFVYTTNTAPVASYYGGMQDTFGGKTFATIQTDHTDGNGQADVELAELALGVLGIAYAVDFNVDTDVESEVANVGWGEIYDCSKSGITDGYRVTWNLMLDWDFPYDDADYDVYAQTTDESALTGNSGWVEAGTTTHENELIIYSVIYTINDEDPHTEDGDMYIEENEWFQGGEEIEAFGEVVYEGTTSTNPPTTAVDVEIYVDDEWTGTEDSDLTVDGIFEIQYTTDTGGDDDDYDFDVRLIDFVDGASEGSGGTTTFRNAKNDNTVPTMSPPYPLITQDGDSTPPYAPATGFDDDGYIEFYCPQISDTGSGVPTNCYRWKLNEGAYGEWTDSYTFADTGVEGLNTVTVDYRDKVWNSPATPPDTNQHIDTDDPSGYTATWSRHTGVDDGYYAYLSGGTIIWFNSGENDYFTVQINDDGAPGNSGYWKIGWDNESVFETWEQDTDALPESKNFYYVGDSSGTFRIHVVNGAGRYQTLSYTATDDIVSPNYVDLDLGLDDDDTADIGYLPNSGYYDDYSVDVTAYNSETPTDTGGSGFPTNYLGYYNQTGAVYTWTDASTFTFDFIVDDSHSLHLYVRDKVGNSILADTVVVVIDTDNPSGFSTTWSRHTGIDDVFYAYLSGATIYFNSGETDYFGIQVNDDGSIQNSAFWKIEWDKNSVFESGSNDTSGLPDSMNFNYNGDGSGTFLIRVVNNAGNYQTFTYTATEDTTKPTGSFALFQDSQVLVSNYYHTIIPYTNASASDSGAGLPTNIYSYKLDSGDWSAWTSEDDYTWSGTDQTNHTLYIEICDNVGNVNSSLSDWVICDVTDPVFGWLTLNETYAPNWYDQSVSTCAQATIYWTDNYPYHVNASCTLTHTNDLTPSGSVSLINFTLTGESDGSYTITITIYDKAGNTDTTLLGSEAPIQLESGMSSETHLKEYWFFYYRSDGKTLDWKEFNTTYVLDEDYREYTEVIFLGVGIGRRFFNDTSSIRIIARDYFQEVLYNQSFVLPSTGVSYIELSVFTFKVASTFDGIINMTVERTSGAGAYTEQIMPYEIFRWDLYATTYNITAVAHISGVYATDDVDNILNDYQIDLSSNDVAIFIDASDPTIDIIWGEVVANDSTLEYGDSKIIGWMTPQIVDWEIWLNGSLKVTGTSSYPQWTWDTSSYSINWYNLTLQVVSDQNAINTSYIRVKVDDTVIPVITYGEDISNNSNIEWGSSYNLTWSLSENCSYTIYLNSSSQTTGTSTSIEWSFITTELYNTYWYNVTLKVTDGGSNAKTQTLFFYNIDSVAPAITIGYASKTVYYSTQGEHTITWTVYDLHNYNYSLSIDGVSVRNGTLNSVKELITLDVVMEIDSKLYKIVVYDSAGNYASDTVVVTVVVAQEEGGQKQAETKTKPLITADLGEIIPIVVLVAVGIVLLILSVFILKKTGLFSKAREKLGEYV